MQKSFFLCPIILGLSFTCGATESSRGIAVQEVIDESAIDSSILKVAYVNPNHSVFDFQKIYIKQPEIQFDPKWVDKFGGRKTEQYRKRIARRYATLLKKAITETFAAEANLTVSDQRGLDVLVIIPKILGLYIDNPESLGIIETVVAWPAGRAKIDLVIYSPKDQAVLGLFMDERKTATPNGIPQSKLRMMNTRAFDRLFRDWAADILVVLEK